jgi:C_GCAxxG_C_C family probable redox protein
MGIYAERAEKLFREGCNCAQAVFLAYSDLTGMDRDTAIRVSASFGGGMGRLREVCGGVSGAIMALGMICAPLDPTDQALKAEHYRRVQAVAEKFRQKHSTIICRELLGDQAGSGHVPEARTDEYYKKRPCEQMVYDGAAALEEVLRELGYDI